ncbi:hypothetical protein NIIDMKKI_50970 [Mycobacterium kansasii]|uniref:Intradiol ring-cleavage dioxygenases domain-containing protein n=5 Tax=Mycobacterium kansasii TaxID=1768 RepID=A0A7G1IFS6_MYCKA|nr:hypothetical protein NIIDMKKI_50970 [Mycobacterium kansasii]
MELQGVDPETLELSAPCFGNRDVHPLESDLTIQHCGEPIGERLVITGRLLDGLGRPVRRQLIEIWQANASGRYAHKRDQHRAPLDPNFTGTGRCLTDDDGGYRFITIRPGAYPWRNHQNAWRPAHIHFSVFGTAFTQRMITQMYFPSDPLLALDPIYQSVTDPKARERLVARYDHDVSTPNQLSATGGTLCSPAITAPHGVLMTTISLPETPGQSAGPFFGHALPFQRCNELIPPGSSRSIRLHGVVTDGVGEPVPDALIEIWQPDADGMIPAATGSLHRDGWTFTGWGRASTDDAGHYSFTTVQPGLRNDSAPFIAMAVFARGLLNHLFTRVYLPGERLDDDKLLASLPADRRRTLVAVPDEHGLRFDIKLQGDGETVFLRYSRHRR